MDSFSGRYLIKVSMGVGPILSIARAQPNFCVVASLFMVLILSLCCVPCDDWDVCRF